MKSPTVSVVMSVYNGADTLARTLQSILDQQGCDFEFIVVNDGSTDGSADILDDWAARNDRLRVIHQQNTGLTRALIRGCTEAQGEFIARQDCGDISLPGRLAKQVECLERVHNAVAASCHTQFVGPRDELLYVSEIGESFLNAGLDLISERDLRGPSHHGSVMMRRAAYEAAGGYRNYFYFAQDLDLWSRLVEQGRFCVIPEFLYQARLEPGSISGTQTSEQRELAKLIRQATQARRSGVSEDVFLARASNIKPFKQGGKVNRRLALGNYFIGSCLRKHNSEAAAVYFRQAIINDTMLWRARIRLFQCGGGVLK